jgi:hypothetical protein
MFKFSDIIGRAKKLFDPGIRNATPAEQQAIAAQKKELPPAVRAAAQAAMNVQMKRIRGDRTTFRSFGKTIGGYHARQMLRTQARAEG